MEKLIRPPSRRTSAWVRVSFLNPMIPFGCLCPEERSAPSRIELFGQPPRFAREKKRQIESNPSVSGSQRGLFVLRHGAALDRPSLSPFIFQVTGPPTVEARWRIRLSSAFYYSPERCLAIGNVSSSTFVTKEPDHLQAAATFSACGRCSGFLGMGHPDTKPRRGPKVDFSPYNVRWINHNFEVTSRKAPCPCPTKDAIYYVEHEFSLGTFP